MSKKVTNVVFAGLGGQGVLKSSDILSAAAFEAGRDVKKAEVHGMSQRGGSVTSDVRFGKAVRSPMVPAGESDFLVVLEKTQIEINRPVLSDDGVLISCEIIDENALPNARSLNVALLGALSTYLDIDQTHWHAAICANLPAKVHEANFEAFEMGKKAAADN